ncbi:MAG: CinA family protein [Sedimentisphaerales bacterium]|nr:CinA family protein [Sedimentisphaerales bacterium]
MRENAFRFSLKSDDMKIKSRTISKIRVFGFIALLAMVVGGNLKGEAFGDGQRFPTRYMIIVTGNELLTGVYPDGHTYFLTRTLRPLGLLCVGSMSVDDKQDDLKEALDFASAKAPLVIVTGGLGPTDNDITRQALSGFTGISLKEHPDALREMARRFRTPPDQLRSNLRRQTQVPVNGTYFKNSNGTAIGLAFERADSVIVALPGPPHELQTMVRNELVPYLSRKFGTRLPGCSLTLRFVGLGQSQIDQTLKDHVFLPPDVTLSSQFGGGRVDFTFSLPDDTPQGRERLRELEQKIVNYLGDNIYADDETSLEVCVIKLLEARGETLTLVEVGSGGSLAATLSDAVGVEHVLVGAFVAPTEDKMRHMLGISDNDWTNVASDKRIERLTAQCAETTGGQWIIAVGEIQRDESNAGYVTVIFRQPDGNCERRKIRVSGAGELAWSRLSTQLLDDLRRKLK